MNQFQGIGNLGGKPEKRTVQVKGDDRQLVTFRCYFSVPRTNDQGEYDDQKDLGFWRNVAIWRPALGDRVFAHLNKGARVYVRGTETRRTWETGEGEPREGYTLEADYVGLDLVGISDVTFSNGAGRQHLEDPEDPELEFDPDSEAA